MCCSDRRRLLKPLLCVPCIYTRTTSRTTGQERSQPVTTSPTSSHRQSAHVSLLVLASCATGPYHSYVVLYPIHTTNRSEAKRTEAKRSEPYCRIRTIHTSTECAAMRIPQFASFHTAHSRMRFVSHWKRSEAKRTIECCYG